MEYELIEQQDLSGHKTKIYSFLTAGDDLTLYERFFEENIAGFPEEVQDIDTRLRTIGCDTGLRDNFFTPNEGAPGDGVCALFDKPEKNLRLYFIQFGKVAVILGGGGVKPKSMRALQESEKLTTENYLLRELSKKLLENIRDRKILLDDEEGFIPEDDESFFFSIEQE